MNPVTETEDMRQSPAAQSFGTFPWNICCQEFEQLFPTDDGSFDQSIPLLAFTVTAGFLQILSKLFSLCVGILPKTWFLERDEAEFVAHFKM